MACDEEEHRIGLVVRSAEDGLLYEVVLDLGGGRVLAVPVTKPASVPKKVYLVWVQEES